MDTHYCFLDLIYTDKDKNPIAYAITKSDRYFFEVEQSIVDENELLSYTLDKTIICDYQKTGGYLVTAPQLPTLVGYPELGVVFRSEEKDNCLKVTVPSCELPYSIYDLIKEGLDGSFLLLDSSTLEQENPQLGIAGFTSIRFSKSTMSVYAIMVTDTGYKNVMLVSDNGTALKVRDFLFAVPEGAAFSGLPVCDFVQKKQIGGSVYSVYRAGTLRLYNIAFCRSAALLNRAAYLSERCTASIKFWQQYLKICNAALSTSVTDPPSWAGSNKNNTSIYGVYFNNSYEQIKSGDLAAFIDRCMQLSMEEGADLASAIKDRFTGSKADLAAEFVALESKNFSMLEMVDAACSLIKDRTRLKLLADMFLYHIRASAFVTQTLLTNSTQSYVSGGAVPTYTFIREAFRFE